MPNLTLRLGRLYHTETHSSKHTCSEVRDDVLFAAHTAPTGGHSVVRGTLLKLDGIAWWPEIVQDVTLMVRLCELRQRNKHSRAPGRDGALLSARINERVHLDYIIMPEPSREVSR